ncbi:MAG TPA: nucleotide exchange factor GrpE [Actinomycetota bacterium]
MSEEERDEEEQRGPRKVKVTDRRRITEDDVTTAANASDAAREPGVGESRGSATDATEPRDDRSEGSSTTDGSGRSAAPLAEGGPAAKSDQVNELRQHLQRMAADFDNYRKRVLKEQTRAVEMAAEPLVRRLLEVLDEFDLAFMAAEQKPDFDKFLHGVELVYAKFSEILQGEGVDQIEAEGKPFDPALHEALMQSGDADGEPFVADVLRPGYTLRGRVIRPAGVKVVRK